MLVTIHYKLSYFNIVQNYSKIEVNVLKQKSLFEKKSQISSHLFSFKFLQNLNAPLRFEQVMIVRKSFVENLVWKLWETVCTCIAYKKNFPKKLQFCR